jgi:hypothetical protein
MENLYDLFNKNYKKFKMKNLKKFIVCTSINKPTLAVRKFDSMKDWKLVIVGDKKTPKNYKLKNGIYLSPKIKKK